MKLMEERLMKKSQADEDEDYMVLVSLHIAYNKQTENKQSLCSYTSGQTCRIKFSHTCLRCIPRQMLVCCVVSGLQCSRGLRHDGLRDFYSSPNTGAIESRWIRWAWHMA